MEDLGDVSSIAFSLLHGGLNRANSLGVLVADSEPQQTQTTSSSILRPKPFSNDDAVVRHPRKRVRPGPFSSPPNTPPPAIPKETDFEKLKNLAAKLFKSHDTESVYSGSGAASADKQINDYIYFLAGLQTADLSDPAVFTERVEKIIKTLVDLTGISEDDITEMQISAEQSSSVSMFAEFVQNGSSRQFSASLEASRSFHLHAEFVTRDGTRVTADLSVEMRVSVSMQMRQQQEVQQSDPIALDLDGDGVVSFSDIENGILFDITGDGKLEQTAFVNGNDAFLAFDANKNGIIDNGKELFGDQNGAEHGFLELGKYDSDGNGRIDSADEIYEQLLALRLMTYGNFEMLSLSELGIKSISLSYENLGAKDEHGNILAYQGSFTRNDGGNEGLSIDAFLNYRKLSEE